MSKLAIFAVLFVLGWSWVCVEAVPMPLPPEEKDSNNSICSENGSKNGTVTGDGGSAHIGEGLIGTAILLGGAGRSCLLSRGEEEADNKAGTAV